MARTFLDRKENRKDRIMRCFPLKTKSRHADFLKILATIYFFFSLAGCNVLTNLVGKNQLSVSSSELSLSQSQVYSGDSITVTITTRDENGNVFASPTTPSITFSLEGGTSEGTFDAVVDHQDGTYTAHMKATAAGTASQVVAWINQQKLTASSATVTVLAGNYSVANSELTVANSTVASATSTLVTLTIYDVNDNPITTGGLTIAFSTSGGSSTGSFSTVVDNGNGTYSANFTGVLAGSSTTIAATIQGNALTGTLPSVTVIPGAPASIVVQSGNNQSAAVGSALASPLQATVTDANGNLIPNATVNWAATSGGGSLTSSSSVTNSSGVAANTLSLGTTTGNNLIQASVNGTSLNTTFTEVATPGTIDHFAFSGVPGTTTSAASFSFTVTARDSYNNIKTDYLGSIAFSSSDSNAVLPSTFTFHSVDQGSKTFNFTLKTSGNQTLTISQTPGNSPSLTTGNITVNAATATQLVIITGPVNESAGTSFPTMLVRALDAQGNTATSFTGAVTFAIASNPGGRTLSGTKTVTAISGAASFPGLSVNKVGTGYTLTASATGLTSSTSSPFAISPAAAASIAISSGNSQTGIVAQSLTNSMVAIVKDTYGNVLPSAQIDWAITSGSGSLGSSTTTTDSSGLSTNQLTLGNAAGAVNITATVHGTAISTIFTETANPSTTIGSIVWGINPANSYIASNSSPLSSFTAKLLDTYGNLMTTNNSTNIVLSLASGTGALGGTLTQTSSGGIATFNNITYTKAESITLQATASGKTVTSSSITVSPNTVSASQSSIAAAASSAQDDGTAVTVTITLKDAYGNAEPGQSVVFAATGSNNTLVQPSSTTNAQGQTTGSIASTTPETKTLFLSTPSFASVTTTVTFINSAVSVANSSIVASGPVTANGVDTSNVIITLLDNSSAPIIGITPSFSATGSANTYGNCSPTNSSGVANCTLSSTKAEIKTVSISGPISKAGNSVAFTNGPATQLVWTSSPSGGAAGQIWSNQGFISIEDAYGNVVVSGSDATASITLSVSSGGGSLAGTTSFTASSGTVNLAGSNLAMTSAGTKNILATKADTSGSGGSGVLTASTSVIINAGPATALSVSGIPTPATAGAGNSLIVTAKDQYNNVATSYTGSVVMTSTDSQALLPTGYTFTNTDSGSHIFTGVVFKTAGGPWTITATDSANSLTNSESGISVSPAVADHLVKIAGDNQSGTVSATLGTNLQVQVQDIYNNPVPGTVLTFTTGSSGGSISPTSATSDANGLASTTLTLGTIAGTDTVSAARQTTALPGSPATVSFTATANAGAATTLAVSGFPSSTTAGTAATLSVSAKDTYGNLVTSYNGTVSFTSSDNQATLPNAYTFVSTSDFGSHTFSGVSLKTVGTQSITASDGTLSGTQSAITVVASSTISAIAFGSAPSPSYTASNSTPMSSFTVKLLDAYGNLIANNSSGTISLLLNTGTSSLGGTLTQTVSAGIATFNNITYTKAESIAIKAKENASGNSYSVTSSAITVGPAVADHLAKITGDSQTVVAGTAVTTNPQAQALDIYGNPVAGVSLTFTPSAGSSVGSSVVTTNASGLASTNFTTATTAGANTLTVAQQTTALPGTPATLTFTETGAPGPAAKLAFTTQPGGADNLVGVAWAQQPVLQILDTNNNLIISGSDSILSITLTPSTGALTGTKVLSATAGVATFSGLSINTSGNITLTATATGSGGALSQASSAFTVHPQPQAPGLTLTSGSYSNSTTVLMTVVCNTGLVLFQESSTAPTTASSGWQTCGTGQSFTIASGDGTHTIYAWGQDAFGNVSPSSTSVSMVLDTTAPTLTSTALGAGSYAGGSTQNITWSASDTNLATSPIKLEYTTDGSAWTTIIAATANSGTYSWTLPTSTNTSQAQVRITATDKATNTKQVVSSAFTIDSTAPTISSMTVNGGSSTATNNYIPISLSASDNMKIGQFCFKYNSTTAPTSTDSCWVSMQTVGLTPASTLTLTNYSFRIGFSGGSYSIYAWVMDQAGNISTLGPTNGVDSGSVTYTPPSPPILTQALATSSATPNTPPSASDLTATSGSTVYIFWQASSSNSIPSNGISLSYTTNDSTYTTISGASGLPNTQGAGCTLFGSYTGCYVWTGGSPTSSYFRVRAQVTDSNGLVANNNALPINASQINFLAGNVSTGTGSSANAAVFLATVQSDIRTSSVNSLVVHPSGTIYFNDKSRGILKVDPATGLQTVFIPIGASQTGDGGPATSANLKTPTKLLLDYQNNLLIWDYDRIRLVNLAANPPTISTFIGGGSNTSATVAGGVNLKFQTVAAASNSAYRPMYALPNGDVLVQADCTGGTAGCTSARWYQKSADQVVTIPFHGTGIITAGPTIDVSTCSMANWGPVLDSTGNLQSLLVNYYTYPPGAGSCTIDSSFHGYQSLFDSTGTWISNLGASGTTNQYVLGKNNKLYLLQRTGGGLTPFSSSSSTFASNLIAGLGYCADGTALSSCTMTLDDVFADPNGNLYFAENGAIRTVSQGNLYTIAGQSLNYGNGGNPILARFGTVPAIGLWNDGTQDRLMILDNQEHYLREAGLGSGGTIQQIAGTGVSLAPSVSSAASTQPIFDTYNNFSTGTFGLDPSGNVYMSSGGNLTGMLNRSTGKWQKFSGGGSTPYYSAANGTVGTQLQYNAPNYMVPVIGYANGQVIILAINYLVSSASYPFLQVGDTTTNGVTFLAGMNSSSAQPSTWCADGTSLSSCDIPYQSSAPSYFGSAYDSQSGAWFLSSPAASNTVLKKIVPGGNMLTYLSGSFTGGIRNLAYNRVSSTVENFWYCNAATGKINKIIATNGIAGTTTTLSWPINSMSCMGYNMIYSSSRNSLVFIYLQNGMYGIAEYLNP